MDTYLVKRDCYWNGLFLRKGQTIKVVKGEEVKFNLLELVTKVEPDTKAEDEPAPKKAVPRK